MAIGRIPTPTNTTGTDPYAEYLLKNGGTFNDNGKSQNNKMNMLLMQMAMSQKMRPLTMLGMILGNLLGGGFKSWKDNYDARGDLEDKITSKSPAELEEYIKEMEQKSPDFAKTLREQLATPRFQERLREAQGGTEPQVNQDAIRQQAMQAITPPTQQGLLGDGGQMAQAANPYGFPSGEELMQTDRERKLREMLGLGGL